MERRVSKNGEGLLTLRSVQALGGVLIIVLTITTVGLALIAATSLQGLVAVLACALISLHGAATLMMVGVIRVEAGIERQQHVEEQHTIRGFPAVEPRGYK